MEESRIAVLLPIYNGDNILYFDEALKSLLGQTVDNVHIFVGVDGPVDDEHKNYLDKQTASNKLSIVYFEENRGLAAVLNDLVAAARKEGYQFLARMDADDIAVPERFERQLLFLKNHLEVDVVGGAIDEIDRNGHLRGKRVQYPLTHGECRKFFRYRDCLAHPAVMFRARYFDKVAGGYRCEYRKNQDTMLWYDGFLNGCIFANIPETVLLFRVNDDFYKRRNGWKRAKKMLTDRLKMNKTLHYDISANLFAFGMFCMTISPSFIKKILYKIR